MVSKISLNRVIPKMDCNTQNAKIASITEKTLIIDIKVDRETHYAGAFNWRNYEYSKKPLGFYNTADGFMTFKAWENCCSPRHEADRPPLVCI